MSTIKVVVKKKGSLSDEAEKVSPELRAKIGIWGDEKLASIASYNEYGWVQDVTPEQSYFLNKSFGVYVKPGNTLSSPPRPFFRATVRSSGKKWQEIISKALKRYGIDKAEKALDMAARVAQTDIQETINNNGTKEERFPDRSPLTLAIYASQDSVTAKGNKRKISSTSGSARSQALVKTGKMLNSIQYEIEGAKK